MDRLSQVKADLHLYAVKLAMLFHLFAAPWTKVEESFNVQAIHDFLHHGVNISQYDHLSFPGVVPRTFSGPLAVSTTMLPLMLLLSNFNFPKFSLLLAARLVFGYWVWWAFGRFVASQEKLLGRDTVRWLCAITATQFHFCFYATRPLPNMFAMVLVLLVYDLLASKRGAEAAALATVSAAVYRAELLLLYTPLFLAPLIVGQLKLHKALTAGLASLVVSLAITIPIDSLLWGRPVWPEAEVWWYNVVENKSHNWGTSPFLWYFYSALPRALGASVLLVPVGLHLEPRLLHFCGSALIFVGLFSFLPHKELRFVIYALPLLNLAAAVACARIWRNWWKSMTWKLLSVAAIGHLFVNLFLTAFFVYGSANNYPGGEAIHQLHTRLVSKKDTRLTIHIDAFNAQTGVSRFLQECPKWSYNKSETLLLSDKTRFDVLLIGDDDGPAPELLRLYARHRTLFTVRAFRRLEIERLRRFPFVWPRFVFVDKVAVLVRRGL